MPPLRVHAMTGVILACALLIMVIFDSGVRGLSRQLAVEALTAEASECQHLMTPFQDQPRQRSYAVTDHHSSKQYAGVRMTFSATAHRGAKR